MIRLRRGREAAAIPPDFRGAKLVDKHVDLVARYFAAAAAAKPMAWDSSKWKGAKTRLKSDAIKKCAYCEAPTSTVAHGDVEHFRPKSIYWWLAYCFDNYLFSCQICNQIYKGDEFPISGPNRLGAPMMPANAPAGTAAARALATTLARDATTLTDADVVNEWLLEAGDLPNPYLEDPEPLFRYKVDTSNEEVWIEASAAPRAAKALASSETYLGINREELRKDRYIHFAMLSTFYQAYLDEGLKPATKRLIESQFKKMSAARHPFAGMSRYFLRSWALEAFVSDQ
jgi:hypothetical protein